MNNEENNLNNGSVQNTNANPEILESTPFDSSQPSSNTPQPSAPSNEAEVLTTEDTSSEQTSNDGGAARVETETAGEAHIHLEAYQVHEKKEKKEIVRTAEEEKGYSRRRVAMILFFIFLIAFVIFLPEIRNLYIQYKKYNYIHINIVNSVLNYCLINYSHLRSAIRHNFLAQLRKFKYNE